MRSQTGEKCHTINHGQIYEAGALGWALPGFIPKPAASGHAIGPFIYIVPPGKPPSSCRLKLFTHKK